MTKSQQLAHAEKKQERPIKEVVPKVFHKFIPTVFSERPIGEFPIQKPYDHAIDLKEDFKPQLQHPFRMDQKQKAAVFLNLSKKVLKKALSEDQNYPKL